MESSSTVSEFCERLIMHDSISWLHMYTCFCPITPKSATELSSAIHSSTPGQIDSNHLRRNGLIMAFKQSTEIRFAGQENK